MKKILVAEDEQPSVRASRPRSASGGGRSSRRRTARQAMARLEEAVFDVLVTDYQMPERQRARGLESAAR
jgi:CheY-like chemotaxis protein